MQYVDRADTISMIMKKVNYLNPALKRVANYILENPEASKTITTKELASVCQVAESTVTRFVHEIGFDSFQELKISIAEYLSSNQAANNLIEEKHIFEDITQKDTAQEIVDKIYYRYMQTLSDSRAILNTSQLELAAQAIEKAEALIFCCIGSSSLAAEEAVLRFSRVGKKCLLFRDESIQLIISAIASNRDVVLGISNSGQSVSVVQCLKTAKQNGAKTIALTSFEDSPIVKYADICLFTPTKNAQNGSGLDIESTSSKNAQILLMDVLYACYATRNFDKSVKYLDETNRAIRNTRSSNI